MMQDVISVIDSNHLTVAYKPDDYDGEDLCVGTWNGSLVVYPDSNKTLVDAVRVGSINLDYNQLQQLGVDIVPIDDDLWK